MWASKENGLVVVIVVLIVGKGGRGGDWAFIHCRGGWRTTGDEPPSLLEGSWSDGSHVIIAQGPWASDNGFSPSSFLLGLSP